MRTAQFISVVASLLWLTSAPAHASDLSKFLDGLFRQISDRTPSGTELNHYTNLTRNEGPLESAIAMYGSDDYFTSRAHRDPNLYVSQLFQAFLGREPRADEQQFWASQFQRGGSNRVELIRWLCQTNHVTQLPSFLPLPPAYSPPNTAPALANELRDKVRLLVNLMNAELGNTVFGNRVLEKARGLRTVTDQYRQTINDRRSTPQQIAIAVSNLDKSLHDLESNYYRVPGSSPQSQAVLRQVSLLVDAARNLNSGWVEQPIAPVPTPPSIQPGAPDVSRLVAACRQFSYGLLSYQNRGPFYENLSRDVQGFSTQIESLALMIRQGQRIPALRQSMRSIVEQSKSISRDVARAEMNIQRGWWNVQNELRPAATALGVNVDFNFEPSRPVIINRPSWPNFPYQPTPGYPSASIQSTISLTNELCGKIDLYTQSLSPLAGSNPDARTLARRLLDFKHDVLVFRQDAARGSFSTSLSRSADKLMSRYQDLAKDVTRMVSRDSTLNSPAFYQIGELVRLIQNATRATRS